MRMGTFKKVFTLLKFLLFSLSLGRAQWENRFNGQGDFSDKFNSVVTDNSGNTFLAGYTIRPEQSKDLLLIKLNADGDTVWTNIYNGPGNGPDEAIAMTIDADGNCFVTGYQKGSGTGYDFITLKYSSAGAILWNTTYNFSSNEFDQSNTIAVDDAGNVFIAGQSDKDATLINNDDYVVIKYNSVGEQQWVKRTNGIGNSTDRPVKILIGTDGNIIVTGRTDNLSDDDYMTVKYDASNGTELWRKYFDRTHHDRPTGMAINSSNGKIYITGRSNNGTNYDYATICYSADGVEQWNAVFDYVDDDRATGIGIDNAGNIYVTGQSDADASAIGINYDILTVKYNASGIQQFAQSFSGPAGGDDIPTGFLADGSGNIFITGYSDQDITPSVSNDAVVLKYNSSGTLQWNTDYNSPELTDDFTSSIYINSDNEILVAGYSETIPNKNGIAIKLNNAGSILWNFSYNGIGDNSDNAHFILRDAHNSLYLGGYTFGYESDRNFLVMKLGASGNLLWQQTINGTSTTQSTDDAIALAFDADENIYATGFTKNSGTGYDMTLAKFNSDGDSLWIKNYNYGSANETDKAVAIGVDAAGHIYITGRSDSEPSILSNDDIVTIQYSSSGLQNWVARYNGTGNGVDQPKVLRIASDGSVYVAGKTFNGTDLDMVLIKYNTAGIQQWTKKYNSGSGDDECLSMTIDENDDIFLCGYVSNSSEDQFDIAVLRYDAAGNLIWQTSYDGDLHGNDEAKGISCDADGNILICGTLDADTSALTLNSDMCTIQLNADGDMQWINIYDGGGNDDAGEIAVDVSNHVYITGQSEQIAGTLNYDFVTIKYQQDGIETEMQVYNGTANASDVPNTMLATTDGFYVTGGSFGTNSQRDIETILYGSTPEAIMDGITEEIILSVFPNPATTSATIDLSCLESKGFQEINYHLLDITGKLIDNQTIKFSPSIALQCENIPAGIYFIQLEFDASETHRIKFIVD